MKATVNCNLKPICGCYIKLPFLKDKLMMKVLPEISDSKSASYNDEAVIGRSFPVKTFSHGDNRTISWTATFITTQKSDVQKNLEAMRAIEAAVYPRTSGGGTPYQPPPICKIKCGKLLADDELCAVLKSYSVKFPTDVPWDDDSLFCEQGGSVYLPYKFTVDMSFEVVYSSENLPGADKIFKSGG